MTDPQLLARIQRATTQVLGEIDRVCREIDVPYVVYGGTAIGAVRHQGFIPWDDDADICMLRDDYERFLRDAPAVLGPEYELLTPRVTPDYPTTFSVVGLRDSLFISEVVRDRPFQMPIGVDIFVLDPLPDDDAAFASQQRRTWVWGRLLFLRGTPTPDVSGLPGGVRQVAQGVMHAVHWGLRGARVSTRALQQRWELAARAYEGVTTEFFGDFSTRAPKQWAVRRSELYPARRVPFEDIEVNLPRDYDTVLRRGFGDYMQLPPDDQRVSHHPYRIEFGPYARDCGEDSE